MSTTDTSNETAAQVPETGTVDFRFEVAILPVSDADRTKQFYASLGWREDADVAAVGAGPRRAAWVAPDNELVLDTKHVSRYHAVLLAGPVHTSVEDLNSTNGVFVNGRRVARQVLKDGDRVTIGRTQYRYTVRS